MRLEMFLQAHFFVCPILLKHLIVEEEILSSGSNLIKIIKTLLNYLIEKNLK